MALDNLVPSDAELVAKMRALREADWPARLDASCKIKLVVAESRREFLKWCRDGKQFPDHEAIFVLNDAAWTYKFDMKSRDKHEVVFIGTVNLKTVNTLILSAIRRQGLTIRDYPI